MKRDAPLRFWAKVRKGAGCWEWTGAKTRGRGVFRFNGRLTLASRVAWELSVGKIPAGLSVLHRCDNPSCVKPVPDRRFPDGHLFTGTQKVNMADCASKGRIAIMRGVLNGKSKLTEGAVAEIRRSYPMTSQTALARKYGVTQSAISYVLSGKVWRV